MQPDDTVIRTINLFHITIIMIASETITTKPAYGVWGDTSTDSARTCRFTCGLTIFDVWNCDGTFCNVCGQDDL